MRVAMTGNHRIPWLARERTTSQMSRCPVQLLSIGALDDRSLRIETRNEKTADKRASLCVTERNVPVLLPEEAVGIRLELFGR